MFRRLAGCFVVAVVSVVSVAAWSATTNGGEPQQFVGMVEAHNAARRAVGEPDLHWSAELARVAQGWATRLGAEGCALRHSGAPNLGENLFWASGWRANTSQVVASWMAEARNYNRATGSCFPGTVCGHYTQIVWRSTQFVGCGIAACGAAEVVVCNYSPPGNYVGERPF